MKDFIKAPGGSSTGITILEVIALVNHYRTEAERARRAAIIALGAQDAVAIINPGKTTLPDAGMEFEVLANKWEGVLRKLSQAQLEESGLGIPLAAVSIKDTEGKDVVKPANTTEGEESTEIEDKETEELANKLIDMDLTLDKKKEIADLWTSGKTGEVIKGDITDEDRKNPEIIVETRSEGTGKEAKDVETGKRSLHDKEKAIIIFDEIMKDIELSAELSRQEKKVQIMAVVGQLKQYEKQQEAKGIEEKLKSLKISEKREGDKFFNGEQLVERHMKYLAGDEFNDLILLGEDDESKVSSDDLVKLQAIRLCAVGEEKRAVSLLEKYYSKRGFTQEIARQFLYSLMRKDAYKELDEAIRNLFFYYEKQATEKNAATAWMKAIPTATSLIEAYTRKFKVDEKGKRVTRTIGEGKQAKQVNEFVYWPAKKINAHIERCIKDAEKLKLIPTGAFESYKKSLASVQKEEDAEESVSSGSKKETQNSTEKSKTISKESSQENGKTGEGEKTVSKGSSEGGEESKTATTPPANAKGKKVELKVEVVSSMGGYKATIPGLEDFIVQSKKDGKNLKNSVLNKLRGRWTANKNMTAKGNADTAPAMPACFAGLEKISQIEIILVAQSKSK